MTLDRYFKQKDSLPNPHGDLSLGISPAVITSKNEVTGAMSFLTATAYLLIELNGSLTQINSLSNVGVHAD